MRRSSGLHQLSSPCLVVHFCQIRRTSAVNHRSDTNSRSDGGDLVCAKCSQRPHCQGVFIQVVARTRGPSSGRGPDGAAPLLGRSSHNPSYGRQISELAKSSYAVRPPAGAPGEWSSSLASRMELSSDDLRGRTAFIIPKVSSLTHRERHERKECRRERDPRNRGQSPGGLRRMDRPQAPCESLVEAQWGQADDHEPGR